MYAVMNLVTIGLVIAALFGGVAWSTVGIVFAIFVATAFFSGSIIKGIA